MLKDLATVKARIESGLIAPKADELKILESLHLDLQFVVEEKHHIHSRYSM